MKERIKNLAFKIYCKLEGCNNCDIATNGEMDFIDLIFDIDIVFYVGANRGDYSKMILERFNYSKSYYNVEIHALDTQDECFKELSKHIEENNIKKIDLLKIDVEGHGLAVLKGLGKYLNSNFVKMIQFEYGGCNIDSRVQLKDLFKILKGYDIYRIMPNKLKRVKYTQDIENNYYCNYVAK